MKRIIYISIIVLFLLSHLLSFSQSDTNIIIVEGVQIELGEIDTENGRLVTSSEGYQASNNCRTDSIHFEKRVKIYSAPNKYNYLVISQKTLMQEFSASFKSGIYYHNASEDTLFSFETESEARALITNGGDYIFLDIASEDSSALLVIDKNGDIIRQFDGYYINLYTQNLHRSIIIYIWEPDRSKTRLIFFKEEGGVVKDTTFYKDVKVQTVSRNEKYFAITDKDSIYFYSDLGDQYFSLKRKSSRAGVHLFNDGKSYLLHYKDELFNNTTIEVKNIGLKKAQKVINTINYNDISLQIYEVGFVDDSSSAFYVSNYYEGDIIFNFFRRDGSKINEAKIPITKKFDNYLIVPLNGEYKVIPKSKENE